MHLQLDVGASSPGESQRETLCAKNAWVPDEGEEIRLTKSRFKDGQHQVLFATSEGEWNMWYTVGEYPSVASIVNPEIMGRTTGSRRKWENIIPG